LLKNKIKEKRTKMKEKKIGKSQEKKENAKKKKIATFFLFQFTLHLFSISPIVLF
jgi:hypothetical protein